MSRTQACIFRFTAAALVMLSLMAHANEARAQAYGVELHNSLMPASGGMGGASVARPQDVVSSINSNPATLTQIRGTQFSFGGGWVEASHDVSHGGSVPGLQAFAGGSEWPGSGIANIGVSQEFSALGLPVTSGLALIGTAGAGAELRDQPGSNGATLGLSVLHLTGAAGVQLTERLSIGGALTAGLSSIDAPFVGSGAMTTAYSIRGKGGLSYDLSSCTTISAYYESEAHFQYSRAIQLLGIGPFLDISVDLPQNVGMGIANNSLMNGRLLLAFDVLYKNWENADLFGAIYDDQWAGILGAQYDTGRTQFRVGYAYAQNNMRQFVPDSAGGVQPGVNAIQFIQGLAPSISPHRVTAGLGRKNVLPGIDMNFFAGTMLNGDDVFGDTAASISSYYLGGGFSWRFRRGSGDCIAPDEWCIVGN